jgi:hypothetical protein
MSRRSLITPEDNLIRSQRRGVPNVRMWSEQETPPRVAWDGWEEEPSPWIATPPDGARMFAVGATNYGVTIPGPPQDCTSGIAVLYGLWGNGDWLPLPSGWRVLVSGALDWGSRWMALVADPGAGLRFGWAPGTDSQQPGGGGGVGVWFTGGEGNRWACVKGPSTSGVASGGFAAPPAKSKVFWQCGLAGSVWTGQVTPPGVGMSSGELVPYYRGGPGVTFTGQAFQDMFVTRIPDTGTVSWDSIGALGPKCSQALCFGWV